MLLTFYEIQTKGIHLIIYGYRKKMVRQPRQYIKSSLKIDLNIDHNSGHEADETLDKLAQFLFSKGFGRLKKEDKRIKEVQRNETESNN